MRRIVEVSRNSRYKEMNKENSQAIARLDKIVEDLQKQNTKQDDKITSQDKTIHALEHDSRQSNRVVFAD